MKKFKFILATILVCMFLFLGMSSNAATRPEETMNPLTTNLTSGAAIPIISDDTAIIDGTSFYCEPFQCSSNYAYVQICIRSIKGNSLWFTLQKYSGTKWEPADVINSDNTILVNDDLKSSIYLMFCGSDKTHYVTPSGSTTEKVLSIATSETESNAVVKNQLYRIVIHNKKQWNGKTAYVNATLQVKNL